MGYLKQEDNVIAWGVISYVFEPTVAKTKKGNVQVVKFNINVGKDCEGDNVSVMAECWGVHAQNPRLKKWNTAFIGGQYKTNSFVDKKTGENRTQKYVRVEFLDVDETAVVFDNIAKTKEENQPKDDIPTDLKGSVDNGELPF